MSATSQDPKRFNDYEGFVEKFKPKKTTDDCMTPPEIYEIVKDWACERYVIDPDKVVRPFWPGGDYENFDYSGGKVVIDNPPFSIRAKIQRFYLDRGIPFFLFAPSLTCINQSQYKETTAIVCCSSIVYENGAEVITSFVTSLEPGVVLRSEPGLTKMINEKTKELERSKKKQLPKYSYPNEVVTAAMVQRYSKYGVEYIVSDGECEYIGALDSQKAKGKAIFGGGLLLSERAAAERAAAERAAAERWELSEREREIIGNMKCTASSSELHVQYCGVHGR